MNYENFLKTVTGKDQYHLADLCIYQAGNVAIASKVAAKAAKKRDKGKKFGTVKYKSQIYYWSLLGLAPNPEDAWLCQCGNWQEDGLHCSFCGAEPPWGCSCSDHD